MTLTLSQRAAVPLWAASVLAMLAAGNVLVHSGLASLDVIIIRLLIAVLLALLALGPRDRRIKATLVLGSTMVALWLGDFVVSSQRPLWALRGEISDPRGKFEVVRELRARGVDAWPSLYAGILWMQTDGLQDVYPLGGISGVTSVMCNEGAWISYRADQHGFNNPPGLWRRPLDIAAVGDSYTMGWCVPRMASFVDRIRREHPATLSLGMGASGPLTQLASIREFLPALRPRLVLWFFYEGNDLIDLSNEPDEARQPMLLRYLTPGFAQGLAARQPEIDARLRRLGAEREREAERDTAASATPWPPRLSVWRRAAATIRLENLRERWRAFRNPPRPRRCCNLALYRRVLNEAKATVSSWGGELVVVYLPSENGFARRRPVTASVRAGDSVIAAVTAAGLPALDLREALREFGPPGALHPFPHAHFNARGHAAVAAIVLRYLRSRGFGPAPLSGPRTTGARTS